MCFWFKIVRLVAVAAVALCAGIAPAATTVSASSSAEFRLDTREGPRESDGSETLTYSSLWDGGPSSDVAIAQVCDTRRTPSETLVAGLAGEGAWNWAVQYDGVYTLAHATATGGVTDKVETATFVVKGLGLPQMAIEASGYDDVFDGRGHGILVTVTDPTYATVSYALAEGGPYSNDPILFTNATDGAVSVWYAAEAEGYVSVTNFATVKISRGVIDDEPGDGTVPVGGISKFDVVVEYDGAGHTVDADAILLAFRGFDPSASVGYALSRDAEAWTDALASFTNACVTSVWYRATSDNFEDYVHEVKVTVAPRDIAKASVAPIDWLPFSGVAVEPEPVVTDGDPSIITEGDYDVSYRDNDSPGTATLVLTGKNNYTGNQEVGFSIGIAELTADVAWKYLQASGTYFAHLEVTCTNGLAAGVNVVRFLFADRIGDDGSLLAALWNTPGRAANANTDEYDGIVYRCVDLDASLITAENVPATYGVRDVGAPQIPVGERTIEMYVQKRVVPESGNEGAAKVGNFVGFLCWESGGVTKSVPVVARRSRSFQSLHAMRPLAAPVSAARLNAALAVGVMPGKDGEPYCRFSEFSIDGGMIRGKVEVGADGQAGVLGANARIVLLKGDSPGGAMSELCSVKVGPDGSFSVPAPKDARFFKLALEIGEVAE